MDAKDPDVGCWRNGFTDGHQTNGHGVSKRRGRRKRGEGMRRDQQQELVVGSLLTPRYGWAGDIWCCDTMGWTRGE